MRAAGQVIAERYEIQRHVGSGGMGEVYLALDRTLGRRVAIKVLPPDSETDPVARERLRREARAAAALDHPFICKIHEVGEIDGESFIVMEFIDGDTLHQVTANGVIATRQLLDIAHALAQALEEAHTRGVVHRDLKPGNIMITRQGHVKVLDFGLAKQAAPAAATDSTGGGTVLTDPGTRVGTPAYMSPEQILGGSVDPRSDIFSLGVILHEAVSGVHPFKRETAAETMAAVLRDPPSSDGRDLEAVPGLRDVVQRMLSKACAERFQTMGELRAEIEALRERSWASTPSALPSSSSRSPLPAERTPFVAREGEFGELRAALDQMLLGHGSIVLIGGEPGVGKTRLVRELQREAHQRGCLTLTGHCYEMEGAPPFVPFVEYMEEAARLLPKALRAALGDDAGEIAAIVPGLRRSFPDIPPPVEVPADQQRRVSFNAYLSFLQRATLKSPSVILFDDLHWADEPTVQLLQHLAPHLASMRTLLVGTYRDVELDVKKPFARALESLVRQRLARRISLRRLAADAVEQLLTRLSGSPAPSSVVKVVFHETEGNPFFIEEVYQHLSEEGRLFDDAGKWRSDLRAETLDVPESVKLVIGRRLERLGDGTRKVLTAAAVIGRMFPLDLLQAIADLDSDTVLDAVEEAERASLLSAIPGRDVRYGFVHELIRTTLVSNLSLPRRQRLHLRIADAVETLRAGAIDSHLPTLAHHLYQAGAAADLDRAARTLARAAQQAHAAGAFEEVIDLTDNLLSLDLPDDDAHGATATEYKGLALQALGRSADARIVLEEALGKHDRRQDVDGIERTAIALGLSLAWSGLLDESFQLLKRSLARLPASAVHARIRLRAETILSSGGTAQFDDAHAEVEDLLAQAAATGDAALLSTALRAEAQLHRLTGTFGALLRSCARALELLPERAHWQRADVCWVQAYGHYYLGQLKEAGDSGERAVAEGRRSGHRGALWAIELIGVQIRLMRSGGLETAIADYDRISNERWNFVNHVLKGVMHTYLGASEIGLAELRQGAGQSASHFLSGIAEANLFTLAAWQGQGDSARAQLESAWQWLPRDARFNSHGRWSALMAIVSGLALLGDRDRLAALDGLGRRLGERNHATDSMAMGPTNGDIAAGLIAAATGDTARAAHHYERALATARSAPNVLLEPMAQCWYGQLEIQTGRRESGRQRLQEAESAFTRLKMPLHVALATRALGSV